MQMKAYHPNDEQTVQLKSHIICEYIYTEHHASNS